jgi:hypothetical protein
MFKIVVAKSFWELWDNLILVFLGNLAVFCVCFGLYFLVVSLATIGPGPGTIGLVGWAVLASFLLGFQAVAVRALVERRGMDLWQLLTSWRGIITATVVFATTNLGLFAMFRFAYDWALDGESPEKIGGFVLLVWLCIVWIEVAMYFLPAAVLQGGSLGRALKTVSLLVFGNPGYSLLVLLSVLVLMPFLVIQIPGPGGIMIFLYNAMTLRLRRYQGGTTDSADWSVLLADVRRALKRRRWKNILFPWRK